MKTPASSHEAAASDSYFADFMPVLSTIECQTQIFVPRYEVLNEEIANTMHQSIRHAKIVYFEHSGHMVPWTEPERFNLKLLALAQEVL